MLKKLTLAALTSVALTGGAWAAGGTGHVEDYSFSFEGPFGRYDQMQLQRGLQVYTEICSSCHGLKFVPLRTLGDPGGPQLPEDQVRAYAEFYEVWDPELLDGEGDFRAAIPTDHFPASSLSNAPDLSLMAKARAGFHGPLGSGMAQFFKGMGGAEYIASLLAGYTGEEKEEAGVILYENTAYSGGWISMAPPLWGDDVEYEDGSPAEIEDLAQDVAAFLMWTAEPKMMARKQTGFVAVTFLALLTVLLYLTNKRVWAPVKARAKETPAE
ncbi:MAG: cytochrome c1 [Pseudomonadota bacterium]